MKTSYRILLSVLLCIGLAAGCYFWVTGMISSNYAYRSPLKDTPPAAGEALGKPATRRVVIVLIDALRYDTSLNAKVMPNLAQLRSQGAYAMMHSQAPSYSEPGYTTILTGAWPWVNDGPAFNLDYPLIPTFTQDNIFSAAHRAGFKTAISGYNWFEKLVPQQDVDLSFYTPGEDKAADADVMAAALPWLKEGSAQLVLIHLDQVDYAGHHEGGPRSENWNKAATRADAMLGEVMATLDFSQDTLLVISDHGQIDAGGHGGQDAICLKEPFVLAGAGVLPGDYGDVNMVDVAPTLAALLGTNIPASAQGQARTQMLRLNASVVDALPGAVKAQQTALVKDYASAIGQKLDASKLPAGSDVSQYQTLMKQLRTNRETPERILRAVIAALFLAAVVFWLIKNIRKGAIAWIICGLTFAFLFNYRYGVWDGKTYSLSSVTSQADLISYVAITSALALVIAWLMIFLDQRYFKLAPAEAARKTFGLVFTTAFINGLPAVLSFIINGVLVTWTLPNYLTAFLSVLSLIEVLIISAAGLVLVGISVLLAWLVTRNHQAVPEKKK